MTPEHRATLTRLLAMVESGGYGYPTDARDCIPALRAVLAVPKAGEAREAMAWESAEDIARRLYPLGGDGFIGAAAGVQIRDAKTADATRSVDRAHASASDGGGARVVGGGSARDGTALGG